MRGSPFLFGLVGLLALTACREPTQIRVEISKDFSCPDGDGNQGLFETGMTIGTFEDYQDRPLSTQSSNCVNSPDALDEIGTIIITPEARRREEIAFEVVSGYRVPVEDCLGQAAKEEWAAERNKPNPVDERGCIWSSRVAHFSRHDTVRIPVKMRFSCLNVRCDGANQVCVQGQCVNNECPPGTTYCDVEEQSGVGGAGGGSATVATGGATGNAGAGGSSATGGLAPDETGGASAAGADSHSGGATGGVGSSPQGGVGGLIATGGAGGASGTDDPGGMGGVGGGLSGGSGGLINSGGSGGSSGGTGGTGGETGSAGGTGGEMSGASGTGGETGGAGGTGGETGGAGGVGGSGGQLIGVGTEGPSCADNPICHEESCCVAPAIDTTTMLRMGIGDDDIFTPHGDDEAPEHGAYLASFYLDKYEVSVSRFRAFKVAADTGWSPAEGDGAHPYAPGATGWQNSYTIDTTTIANCLTSPMTWTETPGANEDLPINCVNWNTAFAFCIWDGGRLPTEAEWEYVAAAGGQNRIFPFSEGTTPPVPGSEAEYNGSSPVVVGTRTGTGFWGHFDLSGNVAEWVFDHYVANYSGFDDPCYNCIGATDSDPRALRGGSYRSLSDEIRAASRSYSSRTQANAWNGFRCARDE